MAAVDGIIANGVTEILKKLSSVVANEITLVWDFNDELKNLQTTLNMIMAVMEDAEKKQVSSEVVRIWMEELKSIAYDAEDILDDYSYEIISGKRTQTGKVRKPSLFFRWRMAHKIKKINEKLNKIAKPKNDLGLQTSTIVGSSSSSSPHTMMMMMENRETYSLVAANWKIVGRENDKSKIINTLLDKDSCLVLSIVGLGGLGKTTMAQLVYNDEVVQKHFQLKIWICVSDPFDVKKLLKNIVNSTRTSTDQKYDDAATMDDIVHGLQDALSGKKFLLVLDDVWNENPEDWYKFKTPFMVGVEGSKILVTTRSMDVASIMVDKLPPYPLGILNDTDSWSVFKEIAFGSAAVGAVETPSLVEIGKEMVNRCGGLPLALIFLGSLMRSKKKEEEWKNIRDTKIWHEGKKSSKHRILPSLRLSYDHLPSHLKQCFSYCCLFPKDWQFHRERLIQLWMAEGFLIESPGENTMSMEEIGNEYLQSLVSNFFFQDVKRNRDGDILTFKMHDLVHDLARSVVGKNECLMVESAHDIELISEATRRLNLLVNLDDKEMLEALKKKAKKLRTVFVNNEQEIGFDIGNAFKENKRLRVLDLSGIDVTTTESSTSSSSSSIGGLKHLRYFDGFYDVFYDFCFPKGVIGRLCFLQTLSEFNVGDQKKNKNACGIEELERLNLLRGNLTIYNLENVTTGTAARRANLKEKKNLRELNLYWSHMEGSGINNDEVVLEGLRPHPNLRKLCINDFEGSMLPRWIEDSSCLPNLVTLSLDCGIYVEQVAGFGALPSLKSLTLCSLKKLKCMGNEFYYSAAAAAAAGGGSSFPSLEKLTLDDMPSLKEWVVPLPSTTATNYYYCFPLLKVIEIVSCPLLTTITPTTTTTIIFPSLKVLELGDIDGRTAEALVTNNLNSLTSLTLWEIANLISLPRQGLMENNNTLLSLVIFECPQFEGFLPPNKDACSDGEEEDRDDVISQVVSSSSPSCLQSLELYGCPAMRFYPNIRSLTSLRKLTIQDCKESRSLKDELTRFSSSSSLEHLEYVQILKNETAEEEEEEEVFVWRKESFFKE